MEQVYYTINNPKTNRKIEVDGAAYKKLISDQLYTEAYLSSLPRIKNYKITTKSTKKLLKEPKLTNNYDPSILPLSLLDDDTIFIIAQNLSYFDINILCQSDKRFNHIICSYDHFWKLKYEQDLDTLNYILYETKMTYFETHEQSDSLVSYDLYIKNLLLANGTWKNLYQSVLFDIIYADTYDLIQHFDIRKDTPKKRKKITKEIIHYLEEKHHGHVDDNKYINNIINIMGNEYYDIISYGTYMGKKKMDVEKNNKYIFTIMNKHVNL